MSYVNPVWLEGQRKRWQRNDAHLWIRHDAHRFMTPAGIDEEKRAAEAEKAVRRNANEAALAAEQDALREGLLRLRRELADIKFDLALRRIFRKYSPDQPRSPKGNSDGGQWVRDAGRDGGLVSKPAAMRRGPSDKRPPLPFHVPLGNPASPETPRPRITIVNNAQTGISTIDEATEKLRTTLEDVVNRLPEGSGPQYGTRVHTEFAKAVRDQELTGIGRDGVEQTFPGLSPMDRRTVSVPMSLCAMPAENLSRSTMSKRAGQP